MSPVPSLARAAGRGHRIFHTDRVVGRYRRLSPASLAPALLGLLMSCSSRAPDADGRRATSSAVPPSTAPAAAQDSAAWADAISQASPHASAAPSASVAVRGDDPVVDGDALRARHRAALARPSPVVVLSGGTAEELGERLCREVVPVRPASTPVLLKPNIGGFQQSLDPKLTGGDDGQRGRITQPGFVRGVVRCLKARGHTRITVADSYGGGAKDWQTLIARTGYEAMAREEGVTLVAMSDDGVAEVQGDRPGSPLRITGMEGTHVPALLMPRVLAAHLEHGMFLSLPKIKAHRFAVVSLGIKSLQGTVLLATGKPAHRQKWWMHRELIPYDRALRNKEPEDRAAYVSALMAFADRMVDVLEVEAPDAVLAEGAPASWGDGFDHLWPGPESVAIGGVNTILVDRVGSEYLGLHRNPRLAAQLGGHGTSPLIERAAARIGLDIRTPELRGDGVARIAAHPPVHFIASAPFAIHDDATRSSLPPPLAP